MPKLPWYRNQLLIFRTNQLTGFYKMAILAFNGLIDDMWKLIMFTRVSWNYKLYVILYYVPLSFINYRNDLN